MKSETALVATQLRYQQWMDDIRDCKARPAGVTVADWCAEHHITLGHISRESDKPYLTVEEQMLRECSLEIFP